MGLVNSVIITAGSIVGLVALGSITGYVISRSTRRWSRGAYYLFLIAIILPGQLGAVPLYMGARALGLTGSAWGMIILYTGHAPAAVDLPLRKLLPRPRHGLRRSGHHRRRQQIPDFLQGGVAP